MARWCTPAGRPAFCLGGLKIAPSPGPPVYVQMGGLDRLPESDLGLGHMEGST